MPMTPEQMERAKKAAASFNKSWEIDGHAHVLKRKDRSWLKQFIEFFVPNRHSLWSAYWWMKYQWLETDANKLEFPFEADQMPVKGVPMKYQLLGKWRIPDSDLKFLKNGPLVRMSSGEVLVPPSTGWQRVRDTIKAGAPLFTVVAAIMAIVIRYDEFMATICGVLSGQ